MKLVLIIGSGAVGKMTVGQELMKITDLRLFHNHMIIEPVIDVFGYFNGVAIQKLREVVFDEFRFPDTDNLKFEGDRDQALADAAKTLVASCATDNFAVSFVGESTFPLPQGRARLYVTSALAAEADAIAQQTGLENPSISLVFLTEIHDTRFDAYSVLRPLEAAH